MNAKLVIIPVLLREAVRKNDKTWIIKVNGDVLGFILKLDNGKYRAQVECRNMKFTYESGNYMGALARFVDSAVETLRRQSVRLSRFTKNDWQKRDGSRFTVRGFGDTTDIYVLKTPDAQTELIAPLDLMIQVLTGEIVVASKAR